MTGQTKLEADISVWLRQYAHAVWTGEDQGCRMLEAADLIERLRSPAPAEDGLREALDTDSVVTRVVRAVAELPDRTSPEDQPHMMLVAGDELEDILRAALSSGRDGGKT